MENFAQQIEEAAQGEAIEAIVFGPETYSDKYDVPEWYSWHLKQGHEHWGKVVDWATARPHLDYTYDDGYGGLDSHCITAWTKSYVLFTGTYDGSSWVGCIPRNPVEHMPSAIGGG